MDVLKKAWNEIEREDEQISKMMANSDVSLIRHVGKIMSYCFVCFCVLVR